MKILVKLTEGLPVGTNLALLQFMWMLISGALLPQRGAIFPALQSTGLSEQAIRRAWAAFRGGVWQTVVVLKIWQSNITSMPGWQEHRYEGYRVVVADVTVFWRPALKNCPSKHYHPVANRALPAVIFGIVGVVGDLGGQRVACPRAFKRVHPKDPSEKRLWKDIPCHVKRDLAEDEILAVDAGVKINDLQVATIERYVLRLANNFTAQRNFPATRPPFLAATQPAEPTGFWDRQPKRTPGRFRRRLMGKPFPKSYPLSQQIREKASVTAHLPKGNLVRLQKKPLWRQIWSFDGLFIGFGKVLCGWKRFPVCFITRF